jgi:hypothetical protein
MNGTNYLSSLPENRTELRFPISFCSISFTLSLYQTNILSKKKLYHYISHTNCEKLKSDISQVLILDLVIVLLYMVKDFVDVTNMLEMGIYTRSSR